MRLSLAFGIFPDELAETMDIKTFGEFAALAELEPWGPERADLQQAFTIAAIIAQGGGEFEPENFVYESIAKACDEAAEAEELAAETTPEDMQAQHAAALRAMATMFSRKKQGRSS